MTALKSAASQASHIMLWFRDIKSHFQVKSDADYLIYALKDADGGWGYIVSGPEVTVTKDSHGDYFNGRLYKAHYEIGESIPPSFSVYSKKARERLGFYHQRNYGGTAEALNEAKRFCDEHLEASRVLPGDESCGGRTPRNLTSDSAKTLPNKTQPDDDVTVLVSLSTVGAFSL